MEPLDKYHLSISSAMKTILPRTTRTSPQPTSPNFFLKSVIGRKKKIKSERGLFFGSVLIIRCRWELYRGQGYLHNQESQLEISEDTRFTYFFGEIDRNNIGSTGCNYLSQASMIGLEHINICAFIEIQKTTRWMI